MNSGLRTYIPSFLLCTFLLCTFGTTSLTSCSLTHRNQKNVLVIAVDQLSHESLSCHKDYNLKQKSGMEELCQDSIRFTHAYTTSLHTRPTMTSLLTGLFPFQHQVRDNESYFLPAKAMTVSKAAVKKGYSTAFLAGSPVVLRDSGLQNGFDLFDDYLSLESESFFRSFKENSILYLNWLERQSQSTFAVLHTSDLYFKNRLTTNELGETRNFSFESQLEEFDQQLFLLLQKMKKENLYDQTLIILVGLNGPHDDNKNDEVKIDPTQVALLIKPISKPRDQGLSWNYDENVSIADIGTTLFDFFGFEELPNREPEPNVSSTSNTISLLPFLSNLAAPKPSTRLIPTEINEGSTELAASIRVENLHFVFNQQTRVYNNLIDRLETAPLSSDEMSKMEIYPIVTNLRKKMKWTPIKSEVQSLIQTNFEYIENLFHGKFQSLFRSRVMPTLPDLQTLIERLQGRQSNRFQDDCLLFVDRFSNDPRHEMEQEKNKKKCLDKRVLFMADLFKNKNAALTENQKKKLNLYLSDFKKILVGEKLNQQIGSIQSQIEIQMMEWLPFLIAYYHPHFAWVRAQLSKGEHR